MPSGSTTAPRGDCCAAQAETNHRSRIPIKSCCRAKPLPKRLPGRVPQPLCQSSRCRKNGRSALGLRPPMDHAGLPPRRASGSPFSRGASRSSTRGIQTSCGASPERSRESTRNADAFKCLAGNGRVRPALSATVRYRMVAIRRRLRRLPNVSDGDR